MKAGRNGSRKVLAQLMSEEWYAGLSAPQPNARSLLIHMLTGEHVTGLPSVWRAGKAYLAECLGWSVEDFERCWTELEVAGAAEADWTARVVWLRAAVGHESPETPNVVKSWAKAWAGIPACGVKEKARVALAEELQAKGPAFIAAFDATCPPAGGGIQPKSPTKPSAIATGSLRRKRGSGVRAEPSETEGEILSPAAGGETLVEMRTMKEESFEGPGLEGAQLQVPDAS